jgi:hypothetical protein
LGTPGSETAKRVRGDDREALEQFIADSRLFVDLLALGGAIERTYDQSALFFKVVAPRSRFTRRFPLFSANAS